MPPRRVTSGQLAGIVALALFTLGTETLPDRLSDAGGAAWLCPLAAGAVFLPLVWLWTRWSPVRRDSVRTHTAGTRSLAALLLLWGLAATAEQACRVGLRLSEDLRALPRGAARTMGTLSVGLYGLVLLEDAEPIQRGPSWSAALFLPLALGTLLVTGRLGPGLAGRVRTPFFQMVSGLGFQGAFQRLEELVSALWLLGDLTLLALLLLALRRLLSGAAGRAETAAMGWLTAAAILVLALCRSLWGSALEGFGSWTGSMAAGAGLTLWAALQKIFEKPKKGA